MDAPSVLAHRNTETRCVFYKAHSGNSMVFRVIQLQL